MPRAPVPTRLGAGNSFNNFSLDGVDNNSYGTSNQGFSSQVVQLSPDAVGEFKVVTDSYSAEYGRAGGAVINAAYRSDTKKSTPPCGSFCAIPS